MNCDKLSNGFFHEAVSLDHAHQIHSLHSLFQEIFKHRPIASYILSGISSNRYNTQIMARNLLTLNTQASSITEDAPTTITQVKFITTAMALRFRAKLLDFVDLLDVYPTMAEALKIAAISHYKDPTKLSRCAD
ncbi:MAG TPA: hypothetical protein VNI77_11295 [Nitrososphaera sp.]|nr:hypothetical protein [Nitrososphaera sp.]